VALIQFQVSPPKTDIENNVIISDYAQMDRILKVGAGVCFLMVPASLPPYPLISKNRQRLQQECYCIHTRSTVRTHPPA
jgi:hypothetical protein